MNTRAHPTDTAQLSRWLRTPRTWQPPKDYASPITIYQATHEASRYIAGGIVFALVLLLAAHVAARYSA